MQRNVVLVEQSCDLWDKSGAADGGLSQAYCTVLYIHLKLSITCQHFTQQPSDTKVPVFISSVPVNLFSTRRKECKQKRMKKGEEKCNLSAYKVSNVSLKQTLSCRWMSFTVLEP